MVNSDLFCPKPRNPSALGAKGLRCHQQSLKQLIACRKPRSFRTFRRRDSIPSHVLFVFCHRRTPSPGRRSQLLPPFLPDTSKVRSSIFLYERVSELASPVTGYSLPSNFPVHSLCVGFPVGSTPSIVIFTFSPAASITTVLFFAPPAPSFDLALFSFQVPIIASCPKHHARATKHVTRETITDLACICCLLWTVWARGDLARILVPYRSFCNIDDQH